MGSERFGIFRDDQGAGYTVRDLDVIDGDDADSNDDLVRRGQNFVLECDAVRVVRRQRDNGVVRVKVRRVRSAARVGALD
jgi:hypothetical protein